MSGPYISGRTLIEHHAFISFESYLTPTGGNTVAICIDGVKKPLLSAAGRKRISSIDLRLEIELSRMVLLFPKT